MREEGSHLLRKPLYLGTFVMALQLAEGDFCSTRFPTSANIGDFSSFLWKTASDGVMGSITYRRGFVLGMSIM